VVAVAGVSGCAVAADERPADTPAEPVVVHRVDGIEVPSFELGADLDGDGSIDNNAALILTAAFHTYGFDEMAERWLAAVDERLATLGWTIETRVVDGRVVVDGDSAAVPLGALADLTGARAEAGWIDASDVQVTLLPEPDGAATLVLAGALPDGYARIVATAFLPYINGRLATGDTAWGAQADTDADGVLTVDELLANRLFQILLAPDLPDGALSFAFELHAR